MITQRHLLWIVSLAALIGAYTALANALERPDLLPTTREIAATFAALVRGDLVQPAASETPRAADAPQRTSDHVDMLAQQHVTLQGSILVTAARVLFGLVVGVPLGIAFGALLAWSRRADDYLHPIYVLIRSVPPLALITYIMLWLGHSEAHRLIPVVYAVATTLVIPTYHGVRDVSAKYVFAARSLGARGTLLIRKVLLPAAAPAVFSGFRYTLAIAWMTAVGAEMLMAENGMGNLLVGGGMWSTRTQTGSDPAVVVVGILALAAAGCAMDVAARLATTRMARWVR
jgi:sulfonate transport system permease protein